jgi:hypothetical protein
MWVYAPLLRELLLLVGRLMSVPFHRLFDLGCLSVALVVSGREQWFFGEAAAQSSEYGLAQQRDPLTVSRRGSPFGLVTDERYGGAFSPAMSFGGVA